MKTPKERVEAEVARILRADKDSVLVQLVASLFATEFEAAQVRIAELESWKSQMLQVWSEIDSQKIAAMLGGTLGESTFEVINRRVPEVLEELKEAQARVVELEEEVIPLRNMATDVAGFAGNLLNTPKDDRGRFAMSELDAILKIHAGTWHGSSDKEDDAYEMVDKLEAKLAKSESGAAVMREALEMCSSLCDDMDAISWDEDSGWQSSSYSGVQDTINAALSTDAGKSMVPRAVLVECRDVLVDVIDPYKCEPCMNLLKSATDAFKSATQALGDSP